VFIVRSSDKRQIIYKALTEEAKSQYVDWPTPKIFAYGINYKKIQFVAIL